ncbi:MAG: glycosyltransferase [Anaerolineae bacterium]|nr:glycosyltransferase [Anaerolineae bacterium]
MNVSVIIPAWNAAETIAETLEFLLAQTYSGWEAIVVDDGSTDGTAAIAASFAEQDARIHTVSQPHLGTSAARNKGVSLAHFGWLLFLDADDWLLPQHLERMTGALISNPDLDAVHCGWTRVASDGKLGAAQGCHQWGELFEVFARANAFATMSVCIVRRSLVEAVGGFDTSLQTCQDWDLWQRIVRTGARFGAIHEVLARYRMRPASASVDGVQLLADGLRVITRGYSPDPRVPNPDPAHAGGLPADRLPSAKLLFACWCAGLVLGCGEDARPLLRALKEDADPQLDPDGVARNIFQAAPLPTCRTPAAWVELWPGLEQHIDEFLLALEEQSKAPGLARRARTALERLILEHSTAARPLTVGATHAVRIEVTELIPDISAPAPVERLRCTVELEGTGIGTIDLPVCDGLVPSYVLADAIAAEFAWPILGRFFERTVYRDLSVEREPTGLSLRRGDLRLAEGLPEDEGTFWPQARDRVGWAVFLQEVWARPNWPNERFYDPWALEEAAARRCAADGWFTVEISEDLPDLEVPGQELDVVLTVGGVALGVVTVPVEQSIVRAQELRAALTSASGFELCRAAVREGLLGRSMADPESLRERLAAAASEAAQLPGWLPVPGSAHALGCTLSPGEPGLVLGRRTPEAFGTSASRRAILPAAAACELVEAAAVAGEPVVQVPRPGERPARVVYAPDLIWRPSGSVQKSAASTSGSRLAQVMDAALHRRSDLEALFSTQLDPWSTASSPYEPARYEQTLALVRSARIARALELACAEGYFTAQLAPQVATDRLPILAYHRVAPAGSPTANCYRVTPEAFEEQLRYLRDAAYYSVRLEEWRAAMIARKPLPGRAVVITFDDGYLDFLTYAWPLLKSYGFSAIVFLVADEVGRSNRWDRVYGEEVPLLGWKEIRQLQDEGVEFGSHSASRQPLTTLSLAEVVREGARSRAILGRGLGVPVKAFAYPYGDVDRVIEHLIGACGYVFGLSRRQDRSTFYDSLLALPRIEVTESDGLPEFVAKIGS